MVRAPQNLLQMKRLRYTTDIFKGAVKGSHRRPNGRPHTKIIDIVDIILSV